MTTVYLDSDYKCHVTDDGTMRSYETDFFDGKCREYIEGYRIIPEGETWVKDRYEITTDEVESEILSEDGEVIEVIYKVEVVEEAFTGLMIAPWKDYAQLEAAQATYDYENVLNEAEKAYEEGVNTAYDTSFN